MRSLVALCLGLGCSLPVPAHEQRQPPHLPELAAELPDARPGGLATMRFLGLPVYDARVWSTRPVSGDGGEQLLAIEVRYARALAGPRIAQRSVDEMRRLGAFTDDQAQRWLQALTRLIPDVQPGDRITAVQRPGHSARFFFNGQPRGEIAEPAFVRLFFGIWLSPHTSEPGLRAQLLGTTP